MFAMNVAGQASLAKEKEIVDSSGNRLWFAMILIILTGLGGAYYFWRKSKKGLEQPQYSYGNRSNGYFNNNNGNERENVDADLELEWLRKAKSSTTNSPSAKLGSKRANAKRGRPSTQAGKAHSDELNFDTNAFQEKMRKLQYAQLPINSFDGISPAALFQPLPTSLDPSLMDAIEQAQEEFEEDEAVRALAVRILAAFRTRNSVEALSQIALYDLSSALRSKAVSVLTEFDHESVFETILLACADPTREVRAAAARGLFRLNFDRSDAWTRIIETEDDFRMSHAVRAAVESGIVQKSVDRLVHEDQKVAYEAFTLVVLMIKAGEDHEIFEAICNHKDERVKFALLHVLKAIKDDRSLTGLVDLSRNDYFPPDVLERIRDAIVSFERVTA